MKTKEKMIKVYQLSKVNGLYWWTGASLMPRVPDENGDYKWTSDISIVKQLNGKRHE